MQQPTMFTLPLAFAFCELATVSPKDHPVLCRLMLSACLLYAQYYVKLKPTTRPGGRKFG